MTNITAVSIAIQVDGRAYFVNLPHAQMMILMALAGSLTDGGALKVVAAPDKYKLIPIGELL